MEVKMPVTDDELAEAVNLASVALMVDDMRSDGLVVITAAAVNRDECQAILDHGRERGILPDEDRVDVMLLELMGFDED
jgi:hypothetical protein